MSRRYIGYILTAVIILSILAVLAVSLFVDFDRYSVTYEASIGGIIVGKTEQSVREGKNAKTVTAVPNDGYRFLKWSDTCDPNPTRTDTNITEDISAKAIFLKISDIKYEILLIYVTEVQATFTTADGIEVVADYKMDERDLQLCHMITTQFDIYLNETFDGLVTFEIDEYYTHEVMREENCHYRYYDGVYLDVSVFAEDIPEVADMLDEYECYLTASIMTDPDLLLNYSTGIGNYKSGTIHLNEYLNPTMGGDIVQDRLLSSYNYYQWNHLMRTYLHEFTHTVEQGLSVSYEAPYHLVLMEYNALYNHELLEVTRLYLLNQAVYQGRTVGIPFPAWTKEVYTLRYQVNDANMGYISGGLLPNTLPLRVAKGYDSGEVTAVPWRGYKFVMWSDGVTTATRVDTNVQCDITVTAIFAPE